MMLYNPLLTQVQYTLMENGQHTATSLAKTHVSLILFMLLLQRLHPVSRFYAVYNIHNIFGVAGSQGDMVTTIYLDGSE